MKKILLLFVGIMLVNCSNTEGLYFEPEKTNNSNLRTVEDAIEIAKSLANSNAIEQRGNSRFESKISSVDVILGPESRGVASDTLIYVVNYSENNGFALISASYSTEPIIGFSDEGSFDVEKATESESFDYYLNAAKNYVLASINSSLDPGLFPDPSAPITTTEIVGPFLKVKWGQSYPEGYFCPNGLCGCAQTAMLQILSYVEQPSSIELTYPERDKNLEYLDWEKIKKHKLSVENNMIAIIGENRSCELDQEGHHTISRLCRQLGYLNGANYKANATSTSLSSVWYTFGVLLEADKLDGIYGFVGDCTSLYDKLKTNDCMAYVYGQDASFEDPVGHMWVADGAKKIETKRTFPTIGGGTETQTTTTVYYHYDWGANGKYNGYFLAGVFDNEKGDPDQPLLPVLPVNSRYNFNCNAMYFIVYK